MKKEFVPDSDLRTAVAEDARRAGDHYQQHVAERQRNLLLKEVQREFRQKEAKPGFFAWLGEVIDSARRTPLWIASGLAAVAGIVLLVKVTTRDYPISLALVAPAGGMARSATTRQLAAFQSAPVHMNIAPKTGRVALQFENGAVFEGMLQRASVPTLTRTFKNSAQFKTAIAGKGTDGEPMSGAGYLVLVYESEAEAERGGNKGIKSAFLEILVRTASNTESINLQREWQTQ